MFSIFERYTPLIEPLSLDEAFLDVTASVGLFGTPADMARRIRREIHAETGLASSAGIASVKFVAKIASDLAKPNGQREVPAEETVAFLAGLPVGRLWGVGPKTEEELQRAGLERIGDVARRDVAWLEAQWGSSGRHLWELSQGIDLREVVPDREAKSVGAEDTFDEDLEGMEALSPYVHAQALRVGRRLRHAGVKGRVVQLKVKFSDFTVITRRLTLPSATDDGQTLYRVACELLRRPTSTSPSGSPACPCRSWAAEASHPGNSACSTSRPPRARATSSTPPSTGSPSASATRPSPPPTSRAAPRRTPSVPSVPSARTDAARLGNNVIPVDPEFPFLLSFLG